VCFNVIVFLLDCILIKKHFNFFFVKINILGIHLCVFALSLSHYLVSLPRTTSFHYLALPRFTTSFHYLALPRFTTSFHYLVSLPRTTSFHYLALPRFTTSFHYLALPRFTTSHYLVSLPRFTTLSQYATHNNTIIERISALISGFITHFWFHYSFLVFCDSREKKRVNSLNSKIIHSCTQ